MPDSGLGEDAPGTLRVYTHGVWVEGRGGIEVFQDPSWGIPLFSIKFMLYILVPERAEIWTQICEHEYKSIVGLPWWSNG